MAGDFEKESSGDCELLAFLIGSQEFCVDVMAVREIRGWTTAVALPHSQHYMRGVVNLRGVILPIIDLAARLGFEPTRPSERHVIIVSKINTQVIGVLVDAVTGIMNVSSDLVRPPPAHLSRAWVQGILAMDGRMISLLSLENILPDAHRPADAA